MKVGGAWIKDYTKDGQERKFISAQLQIPTLTPDGIKMCTIQVALFKNDKKEKDNHPDYNIEWSESKKGSGNSAGNNNASNDIPI